MPEDSPEDSPMDVAACLAAIDRSEAEIKAWAVLDRKAGSNSSGALAGMAVGVKDIIDVAGMALSLIHI